MELILTNQQLPGIPSEQDIADKGLNLGEMNKTLTKKVAELTLYLIENDKREREQEAKILDQESQLNKQTDRMTKPEVELQNYINTKINK